MSGPKCYSVPPVYSIHVFDGKLNEILSLQSSIQILYDELCECCIEDHERNIFLNCSDFLNQINAQYQYLTNVLSISHDGTFGQDIFNKL